MQLQSLTINGFKSFADLTKLDFAPGVTAIVGPNGCGKSNIVDALRWALGEQRTSVLRGERMENVIFAGTVTRKPSGLGEVKVALDNSKGLLSVPYAEVEIGRRLFRDGTSEYVLNGNECRLKDISDLLHDSGMGPNLYTILELKMVEDILREDGEGRRMLFEEAAGVAKYKLRRRQALQKLRQTEEDLLRLADIITEVERQVSSLKRQALRARRYDELSGRVKVLEAALLVREYRRLLSELAPLEEMVNSSSASSEAAKSAIRFEDARLMELRTTEIEADRDLSARRKELAGIVSEISTLEAEEAGLRARDQAARQTIEQARRKRQLLADKSELLRVRRDELGQSADTCRVELRQTEDALAGASAVLAEAESALHDADTRAVAHAERLARLRGNCDQCRRQTADVALERAGFVSRIEMLRSELVSLDGERQTTEAKTRQCEQALAELDSEETAVRVRHIQMTDELQSASQDLLHLEESARALTSLIESTQSKLDLLATLEEKGPRSSSALRALKTNPVDGVLELLGDSIEVEEPYRRALQAALGPAAYYYLTESVESALAAVEMLRRERAGQTTFLAVAEFAAEAVTPVQPPEGTLGTALSLVNGRAVNRVAEHFLARVVVVNDWQAALQYYAWARDNACTLVTLDGQWIAKGGLLSAGSADAGLPADIGLAKQLAALRDRLAAAQHDRESAESEIRQQRSRLARMEQDMSALQRELDVLNDRRLAEREQKVKHESRLATLQERDQSARGQIAESKQRVAACDQDLTASEAASRAAEDELRQAEESGVDLARVVAEAQRLVALRRDARHACERERDAANHRLELIEADVARVEQTLQEIAEELGTSEQQAEQAANDLVGLGNRLKEIETASLAKYRTRDELAANVDQAAARLDEIRNRIAEQEDRLRALRETHAGELEGGRKIELDVARLRGELDALVSSARTQHALDLTAPALEEERSDLLESEVTSEALQELKQKIDRLGPINSLAVEEHARESSRLDGMLKQRDDLLAAKGTLEETISRINETAQARFLHTFEAVRSHFQRLFVEFFPAGEADLILSGADLLEADITLWANPSGKRLKSMSLMSGGEKTMTAIALLFALYQVKPSPFCVFDEVDAPLDDANIERFNRMIRVHSQDTQFILITHNRRTMEIADNLYGVTMEEEGVSKLVSVRLLSSVP